MSYLNSAQKAAYERDGFLAIPDFATPAEIQSLRERAAHWVEQLSSEMDRSVFSTEDQESNSNRYFLESANRISVFMESEDNAGQGHRVNKLGHAMHRLDPVFRGFTEQGKFIELFRDLGFKQPRAVQSMYIFKQPRIGGLVASHQDSAFLYTEPHSVIGFWLAIDDATLDNGCLWAIPGGQKEVLRRRFVREGEDTCSFQQLDPRPLPEEGYEALEVKAGTLVLLHGQLPHKSEANRSGKTRQAFTLHVVEGEALYPESNWLQIKAEPSIS